MNIVEKIYYIENTDLLDEMIALLDRPEFCLSCARELIEMNYSKVTVECLERQVAGVEHMLAKCV